MKRLQRQRFLFFMSIFCFILLGCGSPEEKKQEFFQKGKAYLERKDYVKASLELRNAIQIDPEFGDAYLLLGKTELERRNFEKAYGFLLKAVKLEPESIDARVALGRLMIGGRGFDQAMEQAGEILKREPDNIDGLMIKASVHMSKNENGQAKKILADLKEKNISMPDIFLMLASIAGSEGKKEDAYSLARDGLEKNPDSVPLMLVLAQMEADRRNDKKAEELLGRTIALDPANDGFRMNLAGFYINRGRQDECVRVMNQILEAGSESEAKRSTVAAFWLKNNRIDEAVRVLVQGIDLKPDTVELRKRLGEIYLATKEYKKAKEVLGAGITRHLDPKSPDRINLQTSLAKITFQEGDIPGARQLIGEILENDPKNVDAQMINGNLLLAEKDFGGAVASFRIVVNDHPEVIDAHISLSRAHAMNKEYELALDVLKNAHKREPDSDRLMKAMAEFYLFRDDVDAARKLMEERVRKHPDSRLAAFDLEKFRAVLVGYYFSRGMVDKAESVCNDNPKNTDAWIALGSMYEQKKDYKRAMDIYRQILEQNPKSWDAANNLAFLLAESDSSRDNLQSAFDLVGKARSINPESPYVLDTLGWIEYKRGEIQKAAINIQTALNSVPEHPVINYHMGVIYHAMGKTAEAEKVLKKALEKSSDFQGKDEARKLLDGIR